MGWRSRPVGIGGTAVAASLLILGASRLAFAAPPEAVTAEFGTPTTLANSPSAGDEIGGSTPHSLLNDVKMPINFLADLRAKLAIGKNPFTRDLTFEIAPRWYFRNALNADGSRSVAAAFGGAFGFQTGWLEEFLRIGLTGFTSQRLYGPPDRDGSGLLAEGQLGYTVLGVAYVDLRVRKTTLRIGRQRIELPFINGNDSRMTPNTFEAIGAQSRDWENLRFGLSHVSAIKPRTATTFDSMSSVAGAAGTHDGVTVAGARYDFAEETFLGVVNELGWNTFNTVYAEGEYFHRLGDAMSLSLGAQFADQRSVGRSLLGDFEVQSGGVVAAFGYNSLIASVSGTWTSNTSGILKPWGGSPSFNSVLIADFDRAGESSFRVGLSYDFGDLGLDGVAASTTWVYGATPNSGPTASPDQQEFDVNFDYRPKFAHLDGVWLRVRYGILDSAGSETGPTVEDFRVILNYSIQF